MALVIEYNFDLFYFGAYFYFNKCTCDLYNLLVSWYQGISKHFWLSSMVSSKVSSIGFSLGIYYDG